MADTTVQYKGINLSGLEFGGTGGKLYHNYIIPGAEHYHYWGSDVGANVVRIPFKWERLQQEPGGELNADYLNLLIKSVNYAKDNGMTAILDMHNFGSYFGSKIGSDSVSVQDFGDVWTKLGAVFNHDQSVWLNLMNEPYGFVAETWADYTQEVVNAMRDAGIDNKLLLSGTEWSGAHSWVKSGNAAAYEDFVDPLNNFAFDVHQYLDKWSTGTTGVAAEGVGSTALIAITEWAENNNFQLFLGEVGAADSTVPGQELALSELQDLFAFMEAHGEAWLGWTLWGAGPWWPESYHFNINPDGIKTSDPVHSSVIEAILSDFEITESMSTSQIEAALFSMTTDEEEVDIENDPTNDIAPASGDSLQFESQGKGKQNASEHDIADIPNSSSQFYIANMAKLLSGSASAMADDYLDTFFNTAVHPGNATALSHSNATFFGDIADIDIF